jgi:hypothetical protein
MAQNSALPFSPAQPTSPELGSPEDLNRKLEKNNVMVRLKRLAKVATGPAPQSTTGDQAALAVELDDLRRRSGIIPGIDLPDEGADQKETRSIVLNPSEDQDPMVADLRRRAGIRVSGR